MKQQAKAHRAGVPQVMDFEKAPFLILWELTRACHLACRHCRAKAIRSRSKDELSVEECKDIIGQFKEFGNPLIVLTGGDPVQYPGLLDVIDECSSKGLTVAMTPSGTPSVTREIVSDLKEAGLARLAISLDGPDRDVHDDFRRVKGSFDWSMRILSWAREFELPIQINSTVCRNNIDYFDAMAEFVGKQGIILWSVFFLVPVGRASNEMQITADEAETVMNKMADLSENSSYDVKATAAPQFRRVLIERFSRCNDAGDKQQETAVSPGDIEGLKPSLRLGTLRSYGAVNDGRGLMFVSHTGEVQPSGFLPLVAGNVREESVLAIYRESELFTSLRDPDLIKGKCGACRYKAVCAGSRARAFGYFGDYLAEDPLCAFEDTKDRRC